MQTLDTAVNLDIHIRYAKIKRFVLYVVQKNIPQIGIVQIPNVLIVDNLIMLNRKSVPFIYTTLNLSY